MTPPDLDPAAERASPLEPCFVAAELSFAMAGDPSLPPPTFCFTVEGDCYPSGLLAFTTLGDAASGGASPSPPLLLVTDHGNQAVHVLDVVNRWHMGYVAPPGTIRGPRGVASRGSLAAVTAWDSIVASTGDHVVCIFEGSGSTWVPVRVIGGPQGSGTGQLNCPLGLRFTWDGMGLVVAEWLNYHMSLFRVRDGSFVRHVAKGTGGACRRGGV